MKKFNLCLTVLAVQFHLLAQFKEIDEKKEFLGIPFLSAPVYSRLEYFKPGADFNLYTLKSRIAFETPRYTVSTIYLAIKKGRIMDFICEIGSDKDFEAIGEDLSHSFSIQVDGEKAKTYHGENIIFALSKDKNSKLWLFIGTNRTDTISNVKDNTGMIALLGKKYFDSDVQRFLSSLPKSEKKLYDKYQTMEFIGPGFTIVFNGTDDNAVLKSLNFDLNKDGYYVTKSTFNSSMPLPYGINATTTMNQLRDLFGNDDSNNYELVKVFKYRNYHVEATFNKPLKSKKDEEVLVTLKIE